MIGDAASYYAITVDGNSGTAGDGLAVTNGFGFTAYDADHDGMTPYNCAERFNGGWWHHACHHGMFTGEYRTTTIPISGTGMAWKYWNGWTTPLKVTTMAIKTST